MVKIRGKESAGLQFILFLTPLIVIPFLNDLYALPKATLFWLVIPVFLAGRNFGLKREQIPVYLWVAVYFISSVFSICSFLSFIGNYRYYFHGFVSVFAGFSLFMISRSGTNAELKKTAKILLLSIFVCSVIGFLQLPVNRISSTFGNPNFFGGVLAMALPMTVFFAAEDKRFLIFPAVFFTALLLTYSRASWIGSASGLLFLFIFSRKRENMLKVFLIFPVVIFLVVLVAPTQAVSLFERVLSIFNLSETDIVLRLKGYAAAFEIFRTHPFFGRGPESFLLLFRESVARSFVAQAGPLAHAGYTHSYPLQILVDTGIFGAGIYFFLIFSILKKSVSSKRPLKIAAGSAVAAHFFCNFFAFPTITEVMIFWFAAGIIFSDGKNRKIRVSPVISIPAAVISFAILVMPVTSEILFIKGMRGQNSEKAFKLFKLSAGFIPQDYHLMNAGKRCITFSQTRNKRLWLERAGKFFKKITKRNPQNALAQNGCGFIYREFFLIDRGEEDFKNAVRSFEKAISYDPFLKAAYLNLAVLYEKNDEPAKAQEVYRRALIVYPENPQFLFNLGVVSGASGEYRDALECWRKLKEIKPDYPKLDLYIKQAEKLSAS